MLYYLHLLQEWWSPLRIFRYITVRTVGAGGTALLFSLVLGPWLIRRLRMMELRQYERKEEAPPLYALHAHKEGTPTMGGTLIIAAVFVSSILWAVPTNPLLWFVMGTMLYMGMVGFFDDYTKVSRKNAKGLTMRSKLLLQLGWAALITLALLSHPDTAERSREVMIPFCKQPIMTGAGVWFVMVFVALVLTGCTNAVNLTDGLDGLAIGCTASVALTYLLMAYVAGHQAFASYLLVPYVNGAGELAVFCGALLGACLGFLWWNCHPASVFMGDTGSLALGGSIAMVALLIKQELTLLIVGGVFVLEAVSVILQVASFRLRGKRIFAMAPIHHHFQMKQWKETQVTIRFWILSIIFALFGVLTLKLR
ncbi:MAG: phospho-N-acetylmuramoyl-pentapeptide-transferase [Kiritimatiellae bacterium]|nr:phospho-N-acetylmuramoyl-pentapeptide-transferase [Kiritimatiellia bacterium]